MLALRLLTTSTLATALLMGAAAAQTGSTNNSKPAANSWMLTPTPYLEWNKDISPAVRTQRDHFWDKSAPQRLPLSAPYPDAMAVNTGEDGGGTKPEIRDFPNRVILTGTFEKHRSVLSASEFSLYTEATVRVGEVFDDQSGSGHPIANQDITLLISGGTVALRSGRILTHNTDPREPFLEPGHKYLFVLVYYGEGDFYQFCDDWDISDGTVRANTPRTQYLARAGRSSLDGLPIQQLGPTLDKLLYHHR